jgi:hypothetical protein
LTFHLAEYGGCLSRDVLKHMATDKKRWHESISYQLKGIPCGEKVKIVDNISFKEVVGTEM